MAKEGEGRREDAYEMAEKKKKSQVLGSMRHSLNLSPHACQPLLGSAGREYELVELEVLVLDTRLVDLDALDGDDALLGRQEPRRRRRVWE